MIAATVSRFVPDFLKAETYETEKQHIFAKLQEYTETSFVGYEGGLTAQELRAKTPYQINTVTARLKELREAGYVYKVGERQCSEMNHDQEVNEYAGNVVVKPERVVQE